MRNDLRRFDVRALNAVVEAARRAGDLTWPALVAEINQPFAGTPLDTDQPIHHQRDRKEELRNQRGCTPNPPLARKIAGEFLAGGNTESAAGEKLPEPGPGRILRFDTRAMHTALDAEPAKRGLTWKQVADELPGLTPSMRTNLAAGPLVGFPRAMVLTQWLGRPAASFVRDHPR